MNVSAAIRCTALAKAFGRVQAVRDVSFTVQPGQLLGLLGPSGCGKTTVLRLIAGFEVPDRGHIEIDGSPVVNGRLFVPPERRRVGMVFQDYALFPHMTVARNVGYGIPRHPDRAGRIQEVLSLVGLLGKEERLPDQLSGGEQQRVALARALAPEPRLLLLDEPFSNLDAGQRTRLRMEVRGILKRAGATAIFVTHDQEEAFSLSDVVAITLEGRIVQIASPQQLFNYPAGPDVAAFLGETNLVPGEARGEMVDCPLGRLPLVQPQVGPVQVLVRRDAFEVQEGDAPNASVSAIEFCGAYQMCVLELNAGPRLTARLPASNPLRPGQAIRLDVRTPVQAFSAEP